MEIILWPNVRDHRRLPVAHFLPRSVATSRKCDTGSRSVDRIVRIIFYSAWNGNLGCGAISVWQIGPLKNVFKYLSCQCLCLVYQLFGKHKC